MRESAKRDPKSTPHRDSRAALLERLAAELRQTPLDHPDFALDIERRSATGRGVPLPLQGDRYAILVLLLAARGAPVTDTRLAAALAGPGVLVDDDPGLQERTYQGVRRLRKTLDRAVRGLGSLVHYDDRRAWIAVPETGSPRGAVPGLRFHSWSGGPEGLWSIDDPPFGDGATSSAFRPSFEELRAGLVHASATESLVEAALRERGWALVRGEGATGKTSLALRLAFAQRLARDALYVDIATADDADAVRAAVIAHASRPTLIVIDNVHRNEPLVRRLFDAWRAARDGSHVLLLGRVVHDEAFAGMPPPLATLEPDAVQMRVTVADLRGICTRILRRLSGPDESPPSPPEEAVEKWARMFGGDLIAFSAAVALKARAMLARKWDLEAADAEAYVRSAYWARLTPDEREDLITLSTLALYEIEAPVGSVRPVSFQTLLAEGVVYRQQRGQFRDQVRFALVHAGLGELILAAAGLDRDAAQQRLAETAKRDALLGFVAVSRLLAEERVADAKDILGAIARDPALLADGIVRGGAHMLALNVSRLTASGLLSAGDLERHLTPAAEQLAERVAFSPPHFASRALSYMAEQMPALHGQVRAIIESRPHLLGSLVSKTAGARVANQVGMIRYARRGNDGLARALATALSAPGTFPGIVASLAAADYDPIAYLEELSWLPGAPHHALRDALLADVPAIALARALVRSPLSGITGSLLRAAALVPELRDRMLDLFAAEHAAVLAEKVAEADAPEAAAFLAVIRLGSPDLYERLFPLASAEARSIGVGAPTRARSAAAEGARAAEPGARPRADEREDLATDPDELAGLRTGELVGRLRRLDAALPDDQLELAVAALLGPRLVTVIAARAAFAPLDQTAALDRSLKELRPDLAGAFTSELASPQHVVRLAQRACTAPLDAFRMFITHCAVAPLVVAAISPEEWTARWRSRERDSVLPFPRVAAALEELGRPELACAPAAWLLSAPSVAWDGAGLGHMGHVLRAASEASLPEKLQALARLAAPTWLRERFRRDAVPALCGTLYSVYVHQPDPVVAHFMCAALRDRFRSSVAVPSDDVDVLRAQIRALGVAALLRIDVPVTRRWSAASVTDDAWVLRGARRDAGVSAAEVQFWLGAAALVAAGMRLSVPPAQGEAAATRLERARPVHPRQSAINAALLAWLESARSAAWDLSAGAPDVGELSADRSFG